MSRARHLAFLLICLGGSIFAQGAAAPFIPHPIAEIPEGLEVDETVGPRFTQDGRAVAYVGKKGNQTHPVINDWVGEAYVFCSPPAVGATDADIAFRVGRRLSATKERWWILRGKKPVEAEDWIGEPSFDPGGKRLAYWVQPGARIVGDGSYARKPMRLVIDGKRGERWDDSIALLPIAFSADGKRFATSAQKGREWYIVNSLSKKKGSKGYAQVDDPSLSANGRKLAFAAMVPDKQGRRGGPPSMTPGMMPGMRRAVIWGREEFGEGYDGAGCPVVSPDGKRVAYKVLKDERMGIALGKRRAETPWSFVATPVFAPKGKRLAYAANEGGRVSPFLRLTRMADHQVEGGTWRLVMGKEKGPAHDALRDIVFDPSGRRLAYCAREGKAWRVIVGDSRSEAFDAVGRPQWRRDGKAVAFGAQKGRAFTWEVLDLS